MREGSTPSNSPSGWPARDPFIIVGVPRSGTTMLRLMLNSHPRLRVPFEWPFLDLVQAASRYSNLSDPAHLRQLLDGFAEDSFVRRGGLITQKEKILACEIHDCASLVRAIGEVDAAEHGKQRFGIKMSYYASRIDEIRQLFPARGSSISCATAAGSPRRTASSPGARAMCRMSRRPGART